MRELFHYICCSIGYYCWLVVGCGSPEGLEIEGLFFHCAMCIDRLAVKWLWAGRLGRVVVKDCAITCRFESWNSIAVVLIAVAMPVV